MRGKAAWPPSAKAVSGHWVARAVPFALLAIAVLGLSWIAAPAVCLAIAQHEVQGLREAGSAQAKAGLQVRIGRLLRYAENRQGKTAQSLWVRGSMALAEGLDAESGRYLALADALKPGDTGIEFDLALSLAKTGERLRAPELTAQAFDRMLAIAGRADFPAAGYLDIAALADRIPAPFAASQWWQKALASRGLPAALRARAETGLSQAKARLARPVAAAGERLDASKLDSVPGYAESMLLAALQSWLAGGDREREDLDKLAGYFEKVRRDRWLRDLYRAAPGEASARLQDAVRMNLGGEHERAAEAATLASRLSDAIAIRAGAAVEYAIANRRLGRYAACMDALRHARRSDEYRWLSLRASLEEMACQSGSRTKEMVPLRNRLAGEASRVGFVDLQLRALSALVEPFHSFTAPSSSWSHASQALELFWRTPLGATNATNVYAPLAMAAASQGLNHAATALWEEAAHLLRDTRNKGLLSSVLLEAGRSALQAGDSQRARSLVDASRQAGLDEGHLLAITGAELALAQGDPRAAARELDRVAGQPGLRRAHWLAAQQAMGRVLMAGGRWSEARERFLAAATETADAAQSISEPRQRYFSLLESEGAWRGLTDALYREGSAKDALAAWQMFRNGSGQSFELPVAARNGSRDIAWASFAYAGSGLLAWMWDGESLLHTSIPSERVESAAGRLLSLSADGASPEDAVRAQARELGEILLGDFRPMLRRTHTILIDADRQLSMLPWPALALDGRPLVETHAAVMTHGWRAGFDGSNAFRPQRPLVVSGAAVAPSVADRFPAFGGDGRESRALRDGLHLTGSQALPERVLEELGRRDVLHFSGHGLNWGSGGGLVLAPGQGETHGLLSASDIHLRQYPGLQLVVLASCGSSGAALRAAPNFDSVTRAFLRSGVPQVVASLWNIDSVATSDLMERFYDGILAGRPVASSLRSAMLATRRLPNSTHPYYWAGLALHRGS